MPQENSQVLEILRINGGTMHYDRLAQELKIKRSLPRNINLRDLIKSLHQAGQLNFDENTNVVSFSG